ncbi:ADP-ribosylglycohydrolase family protein [Trichococcus pasteurii]|uniref:Adp-ribosylation/crystallin j1 n=1 Tax=Trichococcus pasteurii TaxID=43064 RepID=A0A1W1IHG8_9LACT|nr:ADP-ribosylglycohydrolase family protein [Trichococcus pasteurii]SFE52549.1 ADP-ribosylglycohydrolase [Trichococcus pasteurii]SLM52430.1 adp-ribosylation/crystallin j1 [Trichococcus pasteurii]SSB93311.1 adp-ribosylation/crystallin j1 [Trichococcus pasteurii]
MLGAIIGDIVGSRFEWNNHKDKHFELFTEDCRLTDDSIMTFAVAKALIETEKVMESVGEGQERSADYYVLLETLSIQYMQSFGRRYPDCGFSRAFFQWIVSDDPKPYNSFGNGAAMRISPVAYAGRTEKEIQRLSETVTGVSHNHEEGLKGAEATATAIYMARSGSSKDEIRKRIGENYYDLDFTLDEIRDSYRFTTDCRATVPQAIVAFLESTSFEDAIRNAVSLGGDSDTLAAIAGAIAEAHYGIPEQIKERALGYFDAEQFSVYEEWVRFIKDINQ